eukprot:3941758-Rhodomonas_salina.2
MSGTEIAYAAAWWASVGCDVWYSHRPIRLRAGSAMSGTGIAYAAGHVLCGMLVLTSRRVRELRERVSEAAVEVETERRRTEIAHAVYVLTRGTELAYGAMRRAAGVSRDRGTPMLLRAHDAMSGTDKAYDPTRSLRGFRYSDRLWRTQGGRERERREGAEEGRERERGKRIEVGLLLRSLLLRYKHRVWPAVSSTNIADGRRRLVLALGSVRPDAPMLCYAVCGAEIAYGLRGVQY